MLLPASGCDGPAASLSRASCRRFASRGARIQLVASLPVKQGRFPVFPHPAARAGETRTRSDRVTSRHAARSPLSRSRANPSPGAEGSSSRRVATGRRSRPAHLCARLRPGRQAGAGGGPPPKHPLSLTQAARLAPSSARPSPSASPPDSFAHGPHPSSHPVPQILRFRILRFRIIRWRIIRWRIIR